MARSLARIGLGLLGRAQVGLRHDLHQGDAGAVEVDERHGGVLVVQRLAGVLLEMQPLDADPDGAVRHVDRDLALAHHRRLVLADLVALRQVRIEIVLAVEHRAQVDLGLEPEPGAHRLGDAFLVDHRQHAGHRGIDQRHLRVGRRPERGRGAGEQLGLRAHLGMDLHADDDFPVAGGALDEPGGRGLYVHGGHVFLIRPMHRAVAPMPSSSLLPPRLRGASRSARRGGRTAIAPRKTTTR